MKKQQLFWGFSYTHSKAQGTQSQLQPKDNTSYTPSLRPQPTYGLPTAVQLHSIRQPKVIAHVTLPADEPSTLLAAPSQPPRIPTAAALLNSHHAPLSLQHTPASTRPEPSRPIASAAEFAPPRSRRRPRARCPARSRGRLGEGGHRPCPVARQRSYRRRFRPRGRRPRSPSRRLGCRLCLEGVCVKAVFLG